MATDHSTLSSIRLGSQRQDSPPKPRPGETADFASLIRAGKAYAGIGSRKTPPQILELMTKIATELEKRGMILLSGDAEGADSAFAAGVKRTKEVFVPWASFGHTTGPVVLDKSPIAAKALALAAQYHPAFDRLSNGARLLHARNGQQILGAKLDDPAAFVLCWTPEASGSGGTGQAIRIAHDYNVPVYDLADPSIHQEVTTALGFDSPHDLNIQVQTETTALAAVNPRGSVRLGNKRQGSPLKPRPGETVIDIDRTNPILGNPFFLKDHRNDAQRADVIARYEQKYHADIARNGPMACATEALGERVKRGENLILMCGCAPRPCHGHSVMQRIAELVEKRLEIQTTATTSPENQTASTLPPQPAQARSDVSRAAREIEAFGPPPERPKSESSLPSTPLSYRANGVGKHAEGSDKSRSPTTAGTDPNPYSTPGLR